MKIHRRAVRRDAFRTEIRYFAETGDGFDGTAHGHGFRSLEELRRTYWFFMNRGRLEGLRSEARGLLRKNPTVAAAIRNYFTAENAIYAWKEGETLSFLSFVRDLEGTPGMEEVLAVLKAHQRLWRTLELIS
ncbi:MAG: hypothetical protein ACREDK_04105 [Thermoplasmata archaeon]